MERPSFASEASGYLLVLGGLLSLTAVTVTASRIHFGTEAINVVIALGIASVKASLVALFFMHLRHDKPMNALIFVAALVFLGFMLMLTLLDTEFRPNIQPSKSPTSAALAVRNVG